MLSALKRILYQSDTESRKEAKTYSLVLRMRPPAEAPTLLRPLITALDKVFQFYFVDFAILWYISV